MLIGPWVSITGEPGSTKSSCNHLASVFPETSPPQCLARQSLTSGHQTQLAPRHFSCPWTFVLLVATKKVPQFFCYSQACGSWQLGRPRRGSRDRRRCGSSSGLWARGSYLCLFLSLLPAEAVFQRRSVCTPLPGKRMHPLAVPFSRPKTRIKKRASVVSVSCNSCRQAPASLRCSLVPVSALEFWRYCGKLRDGKPRAPPLCVYSLATPSFWSLQHWLLPCLCGPCCDSWRLFFCFTD